MTSLTTVTACPRGYSLKAKPKETKNGTERLRPFPLHTHQPAARFALAQRSAAGLVGDTEHRVFFTQTPHLQPSLGKTAGGNTDRPPMGPARLRQPYRRLPCHGRAQKIWRAGHGHRQRRHLRPPSADPRGRPQARLGTDGAQPDQQREADRTGPGTRTPDHHGVAGQTAKIQW